MPAEKEVAPGQPAEDHSHNTYADGYHSVPASISDRGPLAEVIGVAGGVG